MTLLEQMQTGTALLAKLVTLGGKECYEIADSDKTKDQATLCKALEAADEERVDPEVVSEVQEQMATEDAQVIGQIFEGSSPESLMQETESLSKSRGGKGRIVIRMGGGRHGG